MTAARTAQAIALALVVVGVLLRLAPHPWNVTPVGAAPLAVPIGTLAISDLVLGMHSLWWATWGACALGVLLGTRLRSRGGAWRTGGMAVASSITFFVVTNAAVWAQGLLYPRTPAGLVDCFVAAIPFFRNSLLGDLLWTGILFGAWALAVRTSTNQAEWRAGSTPR